MNSDKPRPVFVSRGFIHAVYNAEYLAELEKLGRNGDYRNSPKFGAFFTEADWSGEVARATYAATRALNLPRAPLYVPGEKPPKGKSIPLSAACRRAIELKKKYPHLTTLEAQGVELAKLIAERDAREAAAMPEAA